MREYFASIGIVITAFILIVAMFIGGGFVGLWWYPFQIKMQTGIVRNSNAYVTSQQDGITQFIAAYLQTKDPDQRKGDLIQACQIWHENQNQYLAPDDASFLEQNCPSP